ncbi:hypothetical protein [Paraburkholderia piptadeniae]|uniref:hypothetical protein n=1 Tax=Paraburkholderia piptadeniae TaxID=1701573 RepID=UPI00117D4078|nr:hypothetical protein [Paraburkholderia piptadeniae]
MLDYFYRVLALATTCDICWFAVDINVETARSINGYADIAFTSVLGNPDCPWIHSMVRKQSAQRKAVGTDQITVYRNMAFSDDFSSLSDGRLCVFSVQGDCFVRTYLY